jgi:hypothetical protein
MKRLVFLTVVSAATVSATGQGTLNFSNSGPGLNAPVFDSDGVTGLQGPMWMADLYWAGGSVKDSSLLTDLGQPANFSTVPSEAGLFFGGPRTINGLGGSSTITAQIRVWNAVDGSGWLQASQNPSAMIGESMLFQVRLADPNSIPTTMTGLNGHPFSVFLWYIPEPSTFSLMAVGVALILVAGGRKCRVRPGASFHIGGNSGVTLRSTTTRLPQAEQDR